MKRTLRLALLASALTTLPAAAQFYAGGSIGRADLSPNATNWAAAGATTSIDDLSTGWRLFGGYRINSVFGVELGYADLGDYTATVSVPGDTGRGRVDVKSWQGFFTATAPIGAKWSLTGKLGIARNEAKMRFTSGGVGFLAADSGSKTRSAFAWGVGGAYHVSKQMAVRVDYESFGRTGDSTGALTIPGRTSESEPNMLSVGVQFSF